MRVILLHNLMCVLALFGLVFIMLHPFSPQAKNNTPTIKPKHVYPVPKIVNKHDEWEDGKEQRNKIKAAFLHAYNNYEQTCLNADEIKPITRSCNTWLAPGLPLTMIDSLDTMILMGLDDVYERAKTHIIEHVNFSVNAEVSMFESSIRYVGGLLGAYTLTNDKILLDRAVDIADRLLNAFNTRTGIPYSRVNLMRGDTSTGPGTCLVDAGGSVQLEFAYLSHLTKNPKYVLKALLPWHVIRPQKNGENLYPVWVDVGSGSVQPGEVSAGAMGDSFYEYVLKYYLITGKTQTTYGDWYFEMADAIIKHLAVPFNSSSWYIASKVNGAKYNKMQHLTCFIGGLFALSAQHLPDSQKEKQEQYMTIGKGVGEFCKLMYDISPTKLSAETVEIHDNKHVHNGVRYWIMRPEAVETWFILYRLTGDPKYRQWGWEFFENIESVSRQPNGYSGLTDNSARNYDDNQQSFFLAETLKYIYLLFTPNDYLPLDKFVLTTEAHVFPIFPSWTEELFDDSPTQAFED